LRNAQSAQLKQKQKEAPDGECAQKGTATLVVFTSPQQLSGNQSNLDIMSYPREDHIQKVSCQGHKTPLLIKPRTISD